MHSHHGQQQRLRRGMQGIGLGVIKKVEERRAELAPSKLQEQEQQFQIEIEGTADSGIAWKTVDLEFECKFLLEVQGRDNVTEEPHVWFGFVQDVGEPVITSGIVRAWDTTNRDEIIGATVAVGAFDPNAVLNGPHRFSGRFHVTFQGFGASREDEDGDS